MEMWPSKTSSWDWLPPGSGTNLNHPFNFHAFPQPTAITQTNLFLYLLTSIVLQTGSFSEPFVITGA